MKIIQISDLHITAPDVLLFGMDPIEQLKSCLEHILTHHGDAELCVLTGDLTHNGNRQAYQRLRQCLDEFLPIPYRLLLGNHDDREVFSDVFADYIQTQSLKPDAFVQGVEQLGEYTAIYLDTLATGYTNGHLCETRLQWLNAQLKAAKGPVLIFSHHPIPDLQFPAMDWLKLANHESVVNFIKQAEQTCYLFAGHVHRSAAGMWHGLPFYTVNGTNHQHELDVKNEGVATSTVEPSSYAVILPRSSGVTVHFQPYRYTEVRFPYEGKPSDLPCI